MTLLPWLWSSSALVPSLANVATAALREAVLPHDRALQRRMARRGAAVEHRDGHTLAGKTAHRVHLVHARRRNRFGEPAAARAIQLHRGHRTARTQAREPGARQLTGEHGDIAVATADLELGAEQFRRVLLRGGDPRPFAQDQEHVDALLRFECALDPRLHSRPRAAGILVSCASAATGDTPYIE